MSLTRVTVTLPPAIVREIDRQERNRSRFILEAVRAQLERRRRQGLRRSLRAPHPGSRKLADTGLGEWARRLPAEDTDALLDAAARRPIRWTPGRGWRPARR